jgi:hypothetical protein
MIICLVSYLCSIVTTWTNLLYLLILLVLAIAIFMAITLYYCIMALAAFAEFIACLSEILSIFFWINKKHICKFIILLCQEIFIYRKFLVLLYTYKIKFLCFNPNRLFYYQKKKIFFYRTWAIPGQGLLAF